MLDLNLGLARLPFDDRIHVVCCSGSDRNCVSRICLLNEGTSAVRLCPLTSDWFRLACSFGSLLGRRPPVSTLYTPSSCVAFGVSCAGSCASDFVMELLMGLMVLAAGAVQLDGNSTEQVGPFSEGSSTQTVPVAGREPSLDTSSALRQDEWAQAAERYGLLRPLWCIARPLGGGLLHRKDGMRSQFILICDLRRFLLTLLIGTQIYVLLGSRWSGGYIECMPPRGPPASLCWIVPTMS